MLQLALCAGAVGSPVAGTPTTADDLQSVLAPIRQMHDLPALAGAIVTSRGLVAIGAVGVRKYGTDTPVTVDDQFHLGSCTKSMTATLLAVLVEEGKLSWETTVAQEFPDLAGAMNPAYRGVTLVQLLAHRGGFATADGTYPPGVDWWHLSGSLPEQRRKYVRLALREPPAVPPGTQYLYSNMGFIIAGAMAERVTGEAWETLLRKRLFEPLGMSSAGFGAMGTPGKTDQPWQHTVQGDKHRPIAPGPRADNAPVLGPAGRVHASIRDWGKYVSLHLRGGLGPGGLLTPTTFQRLHTPPAGDYGYGWLFADRDWGDGRVLFHSGDNTMSYAVVWMAPRRDFAVLVMSNQGNGGVEQACDEAASALIQHYLKVMQKDASPRVRGPARLREGQQRPADQSTGDHQRTGCPEAAPALEAARRSGGDIRSTGGAVEKKTEAARRSLSLSRRNRRPRMMTCGPHERTTNQGRSGAGADSPAPNSRHSSGRPVRWTEKRARDYTAADPCRFTPGIQAFGRSGWRFRFLPVSG